MRVFRYIGVFEKFGQFFLVDKIPLPHNCLDKLKIITALYDDDELMYCEYEVSEELAIKIKDVFGIELELKKFDYAISAESLSEED